MTARHNSNHKGKSGSCSTCDFEEELDRSKKFERKLLSGEKAQKKGRGNRPSITA